MARPGQFVDTTKVRQRFDFDTTRGGQLAPRPSANPNSFPPSSPDVIQINPTPISKERSIDLLKEQIEMKEAQQWNERYSRQKQVDRLDREFTRKANREYLERERLRKQNFSEYQRVREAEIADRLKSQSKGATLGDWSILDQEIQRNATRERYKSPRLPIRDRGRIRARQNPRSPERWRELRNQSKLPNRFPKSVRGNAAGDLAFDLLFPDPLNEGEDDLIDNLNDDLDQFNQGNPNNYQGRFNPDGTTSIDFPFNDRLIPGRLYEVDLAANIQGYNPFTGNYDPSLDNRVLTATALLMAPFGAVTFGIVSAVTFADRPDVTLRGRISMTIEGTDAGAGTGIARRVGITYFNRFRPDGSVEVAVPIVSPRITDIRIQPTTTDPNPAPERQYPDDLLPQWDFDPVSVTFPIPQPIRPDGMIIRPPAVESEPLKLRRRLPLPQNDLFPDFEQFKQPQITIDFDDDVDLKYPSIRRREENRDYADRIRGRERDKIREDKETKRDRLREREPLPGERVDTKPEPLPFKEPLRQPLPRPFPQPSRKPDITSEPIDRPTEFPVTKPQPHPQPKPQFPRTRTKEDDMPCEKCLFNPAVIDRIVFERVTAAQRDITSNTNSKAEQTQTGIKQFITEHLKPVVDAFTIEWSSSFRRKRKCDTEATTISYKGVGFKAVYDAFEKFQTFLEPVLDRTCDSLSIAVPEQWTVKTGSYRPQMAVQFAEVLPDGKLGRSRWTLVIPHYNRGQAPLSLPDYTKGSFMGTLILTDNSKVVVNGANKAEVDKMLDAIYPMISGTFKTVPKVIQYGERSGQKLSNKVVRATIAQYYAAGIRDASPEFEIECNKTPYTTPLPDLSP